MLFFSCSGKRQNNLANLSSGSTYSNENDSNSLDVDHCTTAKPPCHPLPSLSNLQNNPGIIHDVAANEDFSSYCANESSMSYLPDHSGSSATMDNTMIYPNGYDSYDYGCNYQHNQQFFCQTKEDGYGYNYNNNYSHYAAEYQPHQEYYHPDPDCGYFYQGCEVTASQCFQ